MGEKSRNKEEKMEYRGLSPFQHGSHTLREKKWIKERRKRKGGRRNEHVK